MEHSGSPVLVAVVIFVGLVIYFLPFLIAHAKSKKNSIAILALNFFLGWTVLGWIVALVWSLTHEKE